MMHFNEQFEGSDEATLQSEFEMAKELIVELVS